jgi:ribosomal protein S11
MATMQYKGQVRYTYIVKAKRMKAMPYAILEAAAEVAKKLIDEHYENVRIEIVKIGEPHKPHQRIAKQAAT